MYAAVFPLLTARAIEEPFDYLVPDELAASVRRGSVVAVRLGAQTVLGIVLALSEASGHTGRHLTILSVIDVPAVPEELLDIAAQVRDHYLSTLGAALALVLPPAGSLRLRRVLEPTAAGLAALAAGERGAEALETYVGGASSAAGSDRLRRRGWLAAAYRLHVASERAVPRLLTVGEGHPAGLGTRQRAALEYARARRTVDEATLRRRTRLSARGLARLLADDLLRVAGEEMRRRGAAAPAPTLLPEQEAALSEILAAIGRGESVLLHGVTGSGKTEVYLRAAEAVLRSGHGVLLLVPEIGLTGQTVARLAARFPGERIAMFHSSRSSGERLAAWRAAAGGDARLVLGARSAVFAPIRDLGLIVVDEEHDSSYKQDNDPRYDARTVAAGGRAARAPRWCWVRPRRALRRSPARSATPTCRGASTARRRRASRSSTCATHPGFSPRSWRAP